MRSATPWLIRGLSVHHHPNKFAPGGFQFGARHVHRCFTQWMTKIGPIGCLWWHFLYVCALRNVRAPPKFRSTLLCAVVLLVFVFFRGCFYPMCSVLFDISGVKPQPTPWQNVLTRSIAASWWSFLHKHAQTLFYTIFSVSHSSILFISFWASISIQKIQPLVTPVTCDQTRRTCWKSCRCRFTLAEQAVPVDGLAFAENWKSVDCKEIMKFQKICNFPLKIFEKCNSKHFVSGVDLLSFHFVPLTCVINFEFRALRC